MRPHLRECYDKYYAAPEDEYRRLSAVAKADNIQTLCDDLATRSVLEVGAGEGAILQRLSESGFGERLFALEISLSALRRVQEKRIPRLAGCCLFDGYHIPYPDERFDLAILSHVLEHVEHPRLLLYEASRVATYVFVEVPLEDTIRLPGDFVSDDVGHINYYSPKTIRLLVQSCGLRVLRQITTNPHKPTYTYRQGRRGAVSFYVKQALLRLWPALSTALFTYHGSLLCGRHLSPSGSASGPGRPAPSSFALPKEGYRKRQ